MNINSVRSLSDDQPLHDIEAAAANEREATARLIALLAENVSDGRGVMLAAVARPNAVVKGRRERLV